MAVASDDDRGSGIGNRGSTDLGLGSVTTASGLGPKYIGDLSAESSEEGLFGIHVRGSEVRQKAALRKIVWCRVWCRVGFVARVVRACSRGGER